MPNSDTPMGLRPVGGLNGAPFSGRVSRYCIPATDNVACYVGSLVKPAGSADADGVMTVTSNVSTGNPVIGVVVGVEPTSRDSETYRVASTLRYVLVADDPNTLFVVQDDASATLAATNIGMSADLTGFTSGSTITGRSATEVSATTATASGDGTEDVLILGLQRRPDNEFGAWQDMIVRLNNHYLVDASAGA